MRRSKWHLHRLAFVLAGLSIAPGAGAFADDSSGGLLALQNDVSEHELAGSRGRDDVFAAQVGEIRESASLSNTSVNGGMTGSNSISDTALSGLTGFATVIQNTGNNVIIQDALILNVHVNQ